MVTAWRLALLGTGIVLALAVLDWRSGPPRGGGTEAVYAALRDAHAIATPAAACGTNPMPAPSHLVLITARQCMSCRDVGHLLREIRRSYLPIGSRLEVAIAAGDTGVVCDFLRTERIPAAVRLLAPLTSRQLGDSPPIAYGTFNGSEMTDSIAADDGLSLLSLLRLKLRHQARNPRLSQVRREVTP